MNAVFLIRVKREGMRKQVPTEGISAREAKTHSRRRFLLGVGATTAALAGCINGDDDSDDPADDDQPHPEPDYARWLPDEEWLYLGYVDLDVEPAQDGVEIAVDEEVEDPLVTFPLTAGSTTIGLFSISLGVANLFELLEDDEAFESEASSLLVVNGTLVIEGTFDTDELHERLEDGFTTYEQDGTIHGYDRYKPVEVPEEFEGAPEVAISEDAVLVGEETDRLERIVATGDGERESATETDTVEWLAGQVGAGDVAFGHIGQVPEAEFDMAELFGENGFEGELLFQPADGEDVLASVAFEQDQETAQARFGLVADELDEETRETVDTEFGTRGEETTIDIDDDRVSATAVYDVDAITVETDEPQREDLSEAEATELVPPDALSYRYEPPVGEEMRGEFVVAVNEDTAATGIRVETESDWHNEISRPDGTMEAGTEVPVQVDPDGDTVTVFAVDENDDIGEIATKEVPTDDLSSEAAQAVPEEALSFEYEPPETGEFGTLSIEVTADTEADVLVAQPQEAPGFFAGDHTGEIGAEVPVDAGTTLQAGVEPAGDVVVVFATVDGATGEVTRWEGP